MSFLRSLIRWLLRGIILLLVLIGVAWAFGAFWFDLPFAQLRRVVAVLFAGGALAGLIFVRPWWRAQLAVAVAVASVAAWWFTIQPTNDRDWQPDVAQTAYAEIEGDRVVIHNFRNFHYRSKTDYDQRWETRTVHLSNLRGIDFFTDFWGSKFICHTFLSFDFGPDGYVCASIETRKVIGQSYSAIRGFYRQFELTYIIGDERDIVGIRTNFRLEDIRLYHLQKVPPHEAVKLFLSYMKSTNALREKPEWYNALTTNCTTNIRHNIKDIGVAHRWDWQILINGFIAERAYELGAIDTSLPLAELRQVSLIDARARANGDAPDFSARIREGLPGFPPPPTK